jgi:hypothetical protein
MEFDHVGMIATESKADENFVEATKVWVTDPKSHPFRIEWLRYEPDSPVTGPVRECPHVAYRVENIEETAAEMKTLLEPFDVGDFLRVGFYQAEDGAVIELMEYKGSPDQWFDKKH